MENASFAYSIYILEKPDRVWQALIDPEMTAKYWQHLNVSNWKPGSLWEHRRSGQIDVVDLVGKVVEVSRQQLWD